MQDVEVLGGCPTVSKQVGSSPIIVNGRDTTNTIPLTRCPICGVDLQISSECYECRNCGQISFPLYGGSKPVRKPIAAIIDADKVQENARIEQLLAQGKQYKITGDVRNFAPMVIDGYYRNYLENEFERGYRK
ncbi:MAG: hypothetical protein M0Q91_16290 [Methanoregula sp.]|jgi:hypothetical protein|nr:hypothetical protein [Methanoregula sp.]